MYKEEIKSIFSGMLIGLCADINNRVGGICGAFLFSIGLLTICICRLPLFTGRVGGSNNIEELLLMLFLKLFPYYLIYILLYF